MRHREYGPAFGLQENEDVVMMVERCFEFNIHVYVIRLFKRGKLHINNEHIAHQTRQRFREGSICRQLFVFLCELSLEMCCAKQQLHTN